MENIKSKVYQLKGLILNNKKTVISVVATLLLVISIPVVVYLAQNPQIFKSRASEIVKNINNPKQPKFKGYIVEFKGEPLVKNPEGGVQGKARKDSLIAIHEQAKADIFTRLKQGKAPFVSQSKILGEYFNAFNGIALDITEAQANEVKKSSFVKNVYPNLEVHTNLNQSVPLIGADKVWNLKNDIRQNITGKGVNVAVLDTGVDYTHSDLGATKITDRNFEVITDSLDPPIGKGQLTHDQTFVIDNGKVAYPSDNKIYIYSFADKSRTTIDLPDPDLRVIRLVLKDNFLVYFGTKVDNTSNAIYYYDLNTKQHKKIVETNLIGLISIPNNKKIVYTRNESNTDDSRANIYAYDIPSGVETSIPQSPYDTLAQSDGNQVIYSVGGNDCFNKAVVYNLDTRVSRDIFPPDIGPILDFKGSKILYVACSKTNFDNMWKTYYLYDINTAEFTKLSFPSNEAPTGKSASKNISDGFIFVSWINKGRIGDNLVYFSKNIFSNKLIAYDFILKRYVQVNLLKSAYSIDAEGSKVCFLSGDFRIYCHDYDPNNPYTMPDNIFNSKVVDGYNFVDNSNDPLDDVGHGTHVSAIIGSSPIGGRGGSQPAPTPTISPSSLIGVAPDVRIVAYKVLNSWGSGYFSHIISAIETSVGTRFDSDPKNDIDVINMSLGADCWEGYNQDCGPNDPLSQAVDNATDAGITVVVAAGNSGPGASTIGTPGTARKVITVGAVDKNKQIANFSSRGPVVYNGETINKPDVVAPGVNICAAEWADSWSDKRCVDNNHISMSGTSMAAPHVAGVAALLKQAHPDWTPQQIKTAIVSTALNLGLPANEQGSGLVDALASIIPQPSPTPTPFVCTACGADVNKDSKVNIGDFSYLSGCFGKSSTDSMGNGKPCLPADINGDGNINITDFSCLKSQYGKQCVASSSAQPKR